MTVTRVALHRMDLQLLQLPFLYVQNSNRMA